MSIVTKETATVYRGAGRRFFTKDAAYRSFAREALRTVCECEEPDHSMGYPGYTCHYHQDEETYQKYVRRLAGFYRERDRQS